MSLRVVFPSAMLALCTSAGAQTTWYVDFAGTPPGAGTPGDPYTSIQYALSRPTTLNNDTLLVAPGTYVENVGHTSKFVHVLASGGPEATTLRAAAPGFVLRLDGASTKPVFEGFTISGVGASGQGVQLQGGVLRRCIVRDFQQAVAINHSLGPARIEESTIAGNVSGIALDPFVSDLSIANSIVWGNGNDLGTSGDALLAVDYSAGFEGLDLAALGTGNIPGDPGLWDVEGGDFRLRPGSPCIDAGNPGSPLDPDGSPIDMGALTFDPGYAPSPTPYCAGKLNSQGCVPAIGAAGSASATSTGPFHVTASGIVDNKLGFLFYGYGPRAVAFQGGTHCVEPPTKRTPAQMSGSNGQPPPANFCSGAYDYDFQARIQSGIDPGLVPGAMVYAQYYYRDPPASFNVGLSDALSFGIAP